LLIALGITIIVSVVEGGIPNGGWGDFSNHYLWFSMEQACRSHDCGTLVDPMATLLNANGT
jgi:hypothetical protein